MTCEAYNQREIELQHTGFDAMGDRQQCPTAATIRVHPSNLEIVLPLSDPMLATESQFSNISGQSPQRQLTYHSDHAPINSARVNLSGTHEAIVWPNHVAAGAEALSAGDEIAFRIANMFMMAELMTPTHAGGMVRDEIRITVGGRQWRLVQVMEYESLRQQKRNRETYHTYDLLVVAGANDTLNDLTGAAVDVCTLLQIATSARVCPFSRVVRRAGILVYEEFWPLVADTAYGRDILPTNDPLTCRTFLESTWDAFQAVKTPLNMGLLVSLYVKSMAEQFRDMSFIAGSVLMEAFKTNYGLSVAHHPQNAGGYFLRATGGTYSFRQLLTEAWQYYGLTPTQFAFIAIRNSLFHSGETAIPNFGQEMTTLHALIRKLLLRVIGYNGDYLDIQNGYARIPFVP